MKERRVYLAALVLVVLAGSLFIYKHRTLGLPVVPDAESTVWTIEARASFEARGGPVRARLRIPAETPGFEILDEDFISSGYGFSTIEEPPARFSEWTIRRARGRQAVYYRISVLPDGSKRRHGDPHPGYPRRNSQSESVDSAIASLLDQVRKESADIETFAVNLVQRLNAGASAKDGAVELLNDGTVTPMGRARQVTDLLAGARIPSRIVVGVVLRDGVRDAGLVPYVEVHNDREWIPIDPTTGSRGYPSDFLPWTPAPEAALIRVDGAAAGEVTFAITRTDRAAVDIARSRAEGSQPFWYEASLLALPVQVQNVYRILIMVPVGAFVVVVLRTLVGVTTFGTFMPVLIALAFRETDLAVGILLFVMILSVGLGLRFALNRLHLLLVPRLTAVLILVVLSMLVMSVLSFRIGLDRGISIALFPIVILAMVIERMSIIWDELGAREAILQAVGTLFVAVGAYAVVSSELLGHLFFVFPELLLVLLALTLLAGRFTGYRLVEYWRFRSLLEEPDGSPEK